MHRDGSPMRRVVAAALALLVFFFLLPLLLLRGEGGAEAPPTGEATLPLDRTVVSPPPAPAATQEQDRATAVHVKLPDGSVAKLTMADYLWRVVAAEMPASFAPEALKAQAVAARTYARAKMAAGAAAHPEAHVCTDITCCQAYIDPADAQENWGREADAYSEKIRAAVADTDGLVALYQGEPIQAVFFSSAAGRTLDAVEVWGRAVPYLTGVESPEGEEVPNWHTTVSVPLEEFRAAILAQAPQAELSGDPSGWIGRTSLNSAGGVAEIEIGGVAMKGSTVRTLFSLRSATFTAKVEPEAVVFSVTGYGHAVGMSQYGANALAKEGKSFEEILKWYYTGVTIGTIE